MKKSDTIWSFFGGGFLGLVIGAVTALLLLSQTPAPAPPPVILTELSPDQGGPILAEPESTGDVIDVDEVVNQILAEVEEDVTLAAREIQDPFWQPRTSAGAITLAVREDSLKIYQMLEDNTAALERAETAAAALLARAEQAESQRAQWQTAAQQYLQTAEYNRAVAEQNRLIAEQQSERAAIANGIASAYSSRPLAAPTAAPVEEPRELNAREKVEDFHRRYGTPGQINGGIEIRDGRAYGPDGQFMNITRQGGSVLIEP